MTPTPPPLSPGHFRTFLLYFTKKCRNAFYVYKTRGVRTFWEKLQNEFVFRTALLYDSSRAYLRKKPEESAFSNLRKVLPPNRVPAQNRIAPIPKSLFGNSTVARLSEVFDGKEGMKKGPEAELCSAEDLFSPLTQPSETVASHSRENSQTGSKPRMRREVLAELLRNYQSELRKSPALRNCLKPESIMHRNRQDAATDARDEYICARDRFFYTVEHTPAAFPASIMTSCLYQKRKYDLLYRAVLHAALELFACQDEVVVRQVLPELKNKLLEALGAVSTHNFFTQLEAMSGARKIRLGIYDHAMYFPGGGQRYVAEMAALVQDRYEVTFITNRPVDLARYQEWYGLDLSRCQVKVVPVPYFEQRRSDIISESLAVMESHNVFDVVAEESLSHDFFLNGNMLGKVNPLSPVSAFICHFPDRKRETYFQVDKYDFIVTNSEYTSFWLKERWDLAATHRIYPPISMENPDSAPDRKEKIILTVSRFEASGSKKQFELISAFAAMSRKHPEALAGWRFVLAGGSIPNNHYLELVKDVAREAGGVIELFPNATVAEVRELYRRAAIFWHACGLEETLPEKVEHFGMTTVEAMQNYCVPIVIDGGGQREIVEHGESGFRFRTIEELQDLTMRVMRNEELRKEVAVKSRERSRLFNYAIFKKGVEKLFADMEAALLGQDVL